MNSSCAFVILDGFSDVWALPISSCLATRDCYMERIHMDNINQFISNILNIENREKFIGIIDWVQNTFPELKLEIKWNQPMFVHHGTYIIAFSVARAHFAFSPEEAGIKVFRDEAESIGYQTTKMLIKVKWSDDVNYDFIEKVIKYNIDAKKECNTFWRNK